jgi:phosphoserine phosphatase RsbU/P
MRSQNWNLRRQDFNDKEPHLFGVSVKDVSISAWLSRFARQQPLYLLIASSVIAIIWAITGQAPSLLVTLIYSFLLGNLTALTLETAKPARSYNAIWPWFLRLLLLLVIGLVGVTVASAVIFFSVAPERIPPAPRTSFLDFLLTAWKFPFIANFVFGTAYLLHMVGRNRLADRNRQLQNIVEKDLVERRLDGAELEQAREIQQGLLPKEIPQVPGFQIAGAWEPAKVVGGDYYDIIELGGGKLGICIADVVGKGISAALLMANLQAAVRAFASKEISPSRVCSQINSVLCSNIAVGKFVTLFYGVLEANTRTLRFTNAGHLRPLLIESNGATVHLENGGALLGVFPDWRYEDSVVKLGAGDMLLLFTDGITEAMDLADEEFGEERLIAAATSSRKRTARQLQSQLLGHVRKFCNSRMNDDATLIIRRCQR